MRLPTLHAEVMAKPTSFAGTGMFATAILNVVRPTQALPFARGSLEVRDVLESIRQLRWDFFLAVRIPLSSSVTFLASAFATTFPRL